MIAGPAPGRQPGPGDLRRGAPAHRLFHDRHAYNVKVPPSSADYPFYDQALKLVDDYLPPEARTLGRMVYGKRAASCLHLLPVHLRQTLRRARRLLTRPPGPSTITLPGLPARRSGSPGPRPPDLP